jgi:hypothetical protein
MIPSVQLRMVDVMNLRPANCNREEILIKENLMNVVLMNEIILSNYWPWTAIRTSWTRWLGNISPETGSPQKECGDIKHITPYDVFVNLYQFL